jgi:porphobilinogen synthase
MYPQRRMRRLRVRSIQPLLRELSVTKDDLIAPIFIDEKSREPVPVASMPGQFRYPVREIGAVVRQLRGKGIRAVLLFGVPAKKDPEGSSACAREGVIQQAIQEIRSSVPDMVICTDVCACEYTSHGHCGIIGDTRHGTDLLNDPSLALMNRIAVSHAESGSDIVAPSCMLDGQVASIRQALDEAGFPDVAIMSYSTKFASALYGPFREAACSGSIFGDRSTYQIDPANAGEAFRESEIDAEEGADILMVKPAGLYLDLVAAVRTIGLPVAAYQVSGEYAQIKAAAANGWINERDMVLESLTCIKRAGADMIITYFAEAAAGWIDEKQ